MTSAELRVRFLRFFEERGHAVVPSSPLIPANDPTLLFTNAGMVQFKDVFLGREERPYRRAVSSQRCVRAGGKHNDLENVGYTARHHTFFEMLGNFSFGDYFKREAIAYAWEFLTEELGIPKERLWVTVYSEDSEAERIWLREIGVDLRRFARIAGKDNFWSMGDTGPCGPCTEIFYDHGPEVAGGPPGTPDADGDRYVEIWNLVFMQYDRSADGSLHPLPKLSVDTGMGLERLAAVMQGVHDNYQTDLFQPLVQEAAALAGTDDLRHSSLRVLADHIRSCAFLITDGVLPSNEGRGYVLRRIIRRAIRHGYKLGVREPFFHKLVAPLCTVMGAAYPELLAARSRVEQVLQREEKRFTETLEQGMRVLDATMQHLPSRVISGETVFQLYDTYGFPMDLTADVAREHGFSIDRTGFEQAMEAQRERARAASHFSVDYSHEIHLDIHCEFTGYQHLAEDTKVLALLRGDQVVDRLRAGEEGVVVLEKTPFYAESGGQVGDRGIILAGQAIFDVVDTQKQGSNLILHRGRVRQGELQVGVSVHAEVDAAMRQATALNHSATHLLHAALRKVLGDHVIQRGSRVDPERLRFDFSHFEPVRLEQLAEVERLVNRQIRANAEVSAEFMPREEALQAGALALFGEKYGDEVRVLKIGDFSTELCGGTHVRRSGDIGLFKIVSETGVAAGVRRIEAVTGAAAVEAVEATETLLRKLADRVKAGREDLEDRIEQLLEKNRTLEKELEKMKTRLFSSTGKELVDRAIPVGGVKVLVEKLEDADPKTLRDLVDQLKNKLGSAAIVLATVREGKVSLVAGVTKDQIDRIPANEWINAAASHVGGKGGGRPDLAQAGGLLPEGLPAALEEAREWIRRKIA